jgi:RNA polymerase sigma factor (sigma-70 family)
MSPNATIDRVRSAVLAAGLGPKPDSELLTEFLDAGCDAAFTALVRRHGALVQGACRSVLHDEADVADAVQATFIALYRRAAGLRSSPTVAGWLFRVARRTAGRIARSARRRETREARAVRPAPTHTTDLSWREAVLILHEELDRLPDSYRQPLILCYLQGLSRDEAARRLGWSLNAVRGRLERGRAALRQRLDRRGIALSAGLLAAVATPASALPANLVEGILTAGRMPAGVGPRAFFGALVAMSVGLAVALSGSPQPADPPKSPAGGESRVVPGVRGTVLDPAGKPVAGAAVYVRTKDGAALGKPVTTTDRDGRFTVPRPGETTDRVTVLAHAPGFAAGWRSWQGDAPSDISIALAADDVPIAGRVLDLEGKPVAKVVVRLNDVVIYPDGSKGVFDWLARLGPRPKQVWAGGAIPGAPAEVKTDDKGRFRITGLGRDREVSLSLSGPAIAHQTLSVFSVPELGAKPVMLAARTFPASFDLVAVPGRTVRGCVTDAETGKPVAGLKVTGHGAGSRTVTDKDGRYEILGYAKGPKYTAYATPADGSRYFPAMGTSGDPVGLDPVTIDLKMQPGIPVSGVVRDGKTGRPIPATVRYYPLVGNPNVMPLSVGVGAGDFYAVEVPVAADGSFTCAVLGGPGLLTVEANAPGYRAARVDPTAFFPVPLQPPSNLDSIWISVGGGGSTSLTQESYQAIVLFDADPKRPPGRQTIDLTPADPIRGRVVGPDGKPMAGARICGLKTSHDFWSTPFETAEFAATAPHPDRPRRLIIRHDDKKLIGFAELATGSAKAMDYKLEPWGTLTGRLLDADGKPIPRASFYAVAGKGQDAAASDTLRLGTTFTDATGKFAITGLLPGVTYEIRFREMKPKGRAGPVTKEVRLKAGETRDLGEGRAMTNDQ